MPVGSRSSTLLSVTTPDLFRPLAMTQCTRRGWCQKKSLDRSDSGDVQCSLTAALPVGVKDAFVLPAFYPALIAGRTFGFDSALRTVGRPVMLEQLAIFLAI